MWKFCLALGAAVIGLSICTKAMAGGVVFPHAVGTKWIYRVNNGTPITTTVVASSSKSFRVAYVGAVKLNVHWYKTPAGWTSPDFGAAGSVAKINEQFKMKTTGHGGVVIPATSFWKKGYRWTYWYATRIAGSTGPVTFIQTGKMTVHSKIAGYKTITVPAGTFRCFEVREKFSYVGVTKVMGQAHTMQTQATGTVYYARGVGMVESVSHGTTQQLIKYTPGS